MHADINMWKMCITWFGNYYLRDSNFKEECNTHNTHTHLAAEAEIPLHKKVFPQRDQTHYENSLVLLSFILQLLDL